MAKNKAEQIKKPSRLNDPEFFSSIKKALIEEVADFVTDPRFAGSVPTDWPEKIEKGEKIESNDLIAGFVAKVGQDFRLTLEERDELRERFLENRKN
jgi:hypothetical protein